jgi:hypothetical protein
MDSGQSSSRSFIPDREVTAPTSNAEDDAQFCPSCGHVRFEAHQPRIKRGSVEIVRQPLQVKWRGMIVPLSRTETEVFAAIAIEGQLTLAAVDEVICKLGGSPSTRRMVILRIRRKFNGLGALNPLCSAGRSTIRFQVEPDAQDSAMVALASA